MVKRLVVVWVLKLTEITNSSQLCTVIQDVTQCICLISKQTLLSLWSVYYHCLSAKYSSNLRHALPIHNPL